MLPPAVCLPPPELQCGRDIWQESQADDVLCRRKSHCSNKTGLGSTGDIYAELGVTPLININGTVTVIGGSVMKPEVMELMRQGNQHFVLINELEVAAGKFIAKLCKSPSGYTGLVTGGAAAAMVVGYAGMMTEDLEPRHYCLSRRDWLPADRSHYPKEPSLPV